MTHEDKADAGKRSSSYVVAILEQDFLKRIGAGLADGIEKLLRDDEWVFWKKLVERFPGISLQPLFSSPSPERLDELVALACKRDTSYEPVNFRAFFYVLSARFDLAELTRALNEWKGVVHSAYASMPGPPPSPLNPVDADQDPGISGTPPTGFGSYREPAPKGLDILSAWAAGANGTDNNDKTASPNYRLRLIDIERGWRLSNPSLPAVTSIPSGNAPPSSDEQDHGTQVLGIIAAKDDNSGAVGITPNVDLGVANCRYMANGIPIDKVSQCLLEVLSNQVDDNRVGDVILIEYQGTLANVGTMVPAEQNKAEFDAIRLATALGLIVVEVGGNGSPITGGTDIDGLGIEGYINSSLNRTHANFKDSGAIMVSAAGSTVSPGGLHQRLNGAPYGSRIDCYAWGENVLTCNPADTIAINPPTAFGGTSAAAAIIAGAVLAVQSLRLLAGAQPLGPYQMRALLSNPAYGTGHVTESPLKPNGSMPNLAAIGAATGLLPDVYLRDYVGDSGGVPSPNQILSASPDIIPWQTMVANPTVAFGETSGTKDTITGQALLAGQDNFVYIRCRNRGAIAAPNVRATVYWVEPSTFLTPDQWHKVNSVPGSVPSNSVIVGNVPSGNTLTVSPALRWSSNTVVEGHIPGPGHYCFIAILDQEGDPCPNPANFQDINQYLAFVRNNNNVAWRNVDIVSNVGTNPLMPEFVTLPFVAPGWPNRKLPFALEFVPNFPKGSKMEIELPSQFEKLFADGRSSARSAVNRKSGGLDDFRRRLETGHRIECDSVRIEVDSFSSVRLPDVNFPSKARYPIRIHVRIPPEERRNPYEISVRQIYRKEIVGGFTWRLVPPEMLKREHPFA